LLSGIFSLQSQELKDERAIQMVKTSEARINAIALIHRKLYNTDMNRSINVRDYILELVQYLTHAYGYNEKPFTLSSNIKDVLVDVDKAIPLGLILNELISNSFKYAYEGHPHPELKIELQNEKENLRINLSDNGRGLPAKLPESDSFGLRMVSMLMKQLRGSLDMRTDLGTHYTLTIPQR